MHPTRLRRTVRAGAVVVTALLSITATAAFGYQPPGVDVASYQHASSLNWSKVKAAGVKFAFIKATEGTSYRNPYFPSDWAGTARNGIYRGAYHFARPSVGSAAAQARYFVAYAGRQNTRGVLPPVLDLEMTGGLGPKRLITWTRNWLQTVQSLTGRAPIIYCSPYFWIDNLNNSTAFHAYPLWVAHYGVSDPMVPGGWPTYSFWQTRSTGTISGISGNVDHDLFHGTMTGLRKFALDYSRTATDLSITANNTAPLTGQTVTFSGALQTSAGSPLPGATVKLQTRPSGSTTWTTVGTATTTSNGAWSERETVSKAASYRARFGGDNNDKRSTSPTLAVTITPTSTTTTLSSSNASPYAGQRVTFTGTVHDSGGAALADRTVFLADRPAGSRWTRVGTATTDANGAFAFSARVGQPAAYRVRARGDDSYARSTSPTVKESITPPQPTTITEVSALGGDSLTPGDSTTLSGTLSTVNGDPMRPRSVHLFRRDATHDWHEVATIITGSDGSWQARVRPHHTGDYQIRFNGGNRYAGATADPVTVTLGDPLSTTLTARNWLPKRGYISPGRTLRVHGRLLVVDGGGLAPRTVHLWKRKAGTSTWYRVAETVTVAPGGSWEIDVSPRSSAYYRAVFNGGWHYAEARSVRLHVPVH